MKTQQVTGKALHKQWDEEKVRKYVGDFQQSYFAYAADEMLREKAASGGVVTALLDFALSSGWVDGALVCRTVVRAGQVLPEFYIAEDRESLFASQGSQYMAMDFNQYALPLIKAYKGKLAVVALPCDLSHLRRLCENDPEIKRKIILVIGLLCGHNSRPELTELVVDKLRPAGAELTDYRFRQGHWRGELEARFDNGEVVHKPFSYFSDYANLYYFCQEKCHHCHDHTGYDADISVGDIWSLSMKADPIKHNAVITRTQIGRQVFGSALKAEKIIARTEPIEEICEGQARSMPFHYNVSARAQAGRTLGIPIKDTVQESVRWNDYRVARMALANEKRSRGLAGQNYVRRIPRFVLKLKLYVMKGLESI